MAQSVSSTRVLWLRVWGLSAVQGAIALTWVIYNLYLLKLLTQYGFSAAFASGLLIIENVLAAVMEPLMGSLSDRFQHWLGSRFPFIAVGIIAASGCFIAIPAMLAFGGPTGAVRWLLPIVMVLWALAMTIFRSPALSLLGRYAFASNLPQAASILTLVGGLAGAMGPLAGDLILRIGPLFAFTIGSISLLVAATALGLVGPNQSVPTPSSLATDSDAVKAVEISSTVTKLALVFGTGVGGTLGFRLIMQTLPGSLPLSGGISSGLVIGSIFVALAITAIPSGQVATWLGTQRGIVVGLGSLALLCGVLAIAQGQGIGLLILAIALGSVMSLVSNTTIPFALSMVSPQKAGLGLGMYFSGGAVAGSLFGTLKPSLGTLPNEINALIGAAAYGGAVVCVLLSHKYIKS